ncbi:MAG: hypothetical protein MHM6MM_004236 [Cercozoa sp. M6MM]
MVLRVRAACLRSAARFYTRRRRGESQLELPRGFDRVRTRFAPSPTGELHLGGLRSALYNYLFAKSRGGDFLLRIEDTDQTRLVEGSADRVFETLDWAGLRPDEGPRVGGASGPYVQSERAKQGFYNDVVGELMDRGHAYRCFCSADRLEKLRLEQSQQGVATMYDRHCASLSKAESDARARNEPFVVRMRVPEGEVQMQDIVSGRLHVDGRTVDDQVLMKSDGMPTYHLACVVDDRMMEISHVIRGAEWLPSLPKHALLYDMLEWQRPRFAHLPLLLDGEFGGKLSKRNKASSVQWFINQGFLSDAVLNFVAFLGWGGDVHGQRLKLPELVEHFDLSRVGKSGAIVDLAMLRSINKAHVAEAVRSESTALDEMCACLEKKVREEFPHAAGTESARVRRIAKLLSDRASCVEEMLGLAEHFFVEDWESAPPRDDSELLAVSTFRSLLAEQLAEDQDVDFAKLLKTTQQQTKLKGKRLMMPIRRAITGAEVGASLSETLAILGRDTCLRRLDSVLKDAPVVEDTA